jgi:hypothetical protein
MVILNHLYCSYSLGYAGPLHRIISRIRRVHIGTAPGVGNEQAERFCGTA